MKICSWNVASFRKIKSFAQYDYYKSADTAYFETILRSIDADIVFLQESLSNDSHSYARELSISLGLPYYKESRGNVSYIDSNYFETLSVLSRSALKDWREITHMNPDWVIRMTNGYLAKSYDRSYQVTLTEFGTFVHTHFLPEKFFQQDYRNNIGKAYIDVNLSLLDPISTPFYFVGDLNTKFVNEVFSPFFKKKHLINAFDGISTRPVSSTQAIPQDVICYPENVRIKDKGVINTETDHYPIWVELHT